MEIQIALAKKQELSKAQKEYRKFVAGRLKERGKEHPFEGTDEEIAEFLAEISEDWEKHKQDQGIETKD
tara:strand:+ start:16272 stop:16478 length:207 start_codon:yes stop_codon:yes gene_type:complete